MHDLIIIGGGYAGLWAAFSAAREAHACGARLRIALVSEGARFTARVRLYEAELAPADALMPIAPMLAMVDVEHLLGDVEQLLPAGTRDDAPGALQVRLQDGRRVDARSVVLATGSHVARPAIPGLAAHAHDIDSADAAERTWERLHALAPGAQVDIVGGGFTGIELACEIAGWRRRANPTLRVRLSDAARVGGGYSEPARKALLAALSGLGIDVLEGAALRAVTPGALAFEGQPALPSHLVVWTAGVVPSPLTAQVAGAFGGQRHADGRLAVDAFLRPSAQHALFAAGDVAAAKLPDEAGGTALTTFSCQHALSTGTFAGHNAVCTLLGSAPLAYQPPYPYGTCLDLGPAGAMITSGFARNLVAIGEAAKATKLHINRNVIVPPVAGGRAALFAAADVAHARPAAVAATA